MNEQFSSKNNTSENNQHHLERYNLFSIDQCSEAEDASNQNENENYLNDHH